MTNYLKITFGIFLILSASRFIPHPPNFTSLIALSFYIPALLGVRFLPALLLSFLITDLIIGFHNTVFFTWGSVVVIGLISKYFLQNIISRLSGALIGSVWTLGSYGLSIEGLIACYTLALPFFAYSLVSTFIFSSLIETVYKYKSVLLKI